MGKRISGQGNGSGKEIPFPCPKFGLPSSFRNGCLIAIGVDRPLVIAAASAVRKMTFSRLGDGRPPASRRRTVRTNLGCTGAADRVARHGWRLDRRPVNRIVWAIHLAPGATAVLATVEPCSEPDRMSFSGFPATTPACGLLI